MWPFRKQAKQEHQFITTTTFTFTERTTDGEKSAVLILKETNYYYKPLDGYEWYPSTHWFKHGCLCYWKSKIPTLGEPIPESEDIIVMVPLQRFLNIQIAEKTETVSRALSEV